MGAEPSPKLPQDLPLAVHLDVSAHWTSASTVQMRRSGKSSLLQTDECHAILNYPRPGRTALNWGNGFMSGRGVLLPVHTGSEGGLMGGEAPLAMTSRFIRCGF